MKRLMVLSLLALLSGCAAQVVKLDVPELERSESAVISDVRPAAEKEGTIFSLLVTKESYGIYRIAESAVAPTPIRVLRHRAFEKLTADGKLRDTGTAT
jgi:CO/xanthine dehydrogenase FAD-binding subunit